MSARLDVTAWLWTEAGRAVDDWTARWRRGECGPWYLWYARGSLVLAAEQPDGYQLGQNERVPDHRERDGVVRWVVDGSGRLECLPDERGNVGEVGA